MKNGWKIVIAVVVLLGIILAGAMGWFFSAHVFVDNVPYPRNAEFLNLREESLTIEGYDRIAAALPDCEIYWSIPFQKNTYPESTTGVELAAKLTDYDILTLGYFTQLQWVDARKVEDFAMVEKLMAALPQVEVLFQVTLDGTNYSWDAETVTLKNLSMEEIPLFARLTHLKTVDANGCRDYEALRALAQAYPQLAVDYTVAFGDKEYTLDTEKLSFKDPRMDQVRKLMENLPNLKQVTFSAPSCDAQTLLDLKKDFPDVTVAWKKTVFGQQHSSQDTEFDFSGTQGLTLAAVEEAMAYFPKAEKVILCDCGFSNEELAAFREKMRPNYKVVWSVKVTGVPVRTDETTFMPATTHGKYMINEQMADFIYCEDMIVVDIGHAMVKEVEWVRGMPNLKYLILADNWLKDISALESCKSLIYLELFINDYLKDISALKGCTALEDLSVSDTPVDPTPLLEMPWLKNLWINNVPITAQQRQALTEALPNTHIEFDAGFTTAGGWRELQNYYDMRDLLGMPYNAW